MNDSLEYLKIDKLRSDLQSYLSKFSKNKCAEYVYESKTGGIYTVVLTDEVSINLTGKEEITIIRHQSDNKIFIGQYYYVTVALGKYEKPDKHGFDSVEVCYVKLKYNDDYSIYDMDFSID